MWCSLPDNSHEEQGITCKNLNTVIYCLAGPEKIFDKKVELTFDSS